MSIDNPARPARSEMTKKTKKLITFTIEVTYEVDDNGLELDGFNEAIENLRQTGIASIIDVCIKPVANEARP